jgi:hypothetical protein
MKHQLYNLEHDIRFRKTFLSGYDKQMENLSGRISRTFNPQKLLNLPSIYHSIITDGLINALITYFNGREPFLFYTSFFYTSPSMGEQIIHRDINRKLFPTITVLIDIESNIATTRVIKGSHRDNDDPYFNNKYVLNVHQMRNNRDVISATNTDNVIMFDSCIIHHGIHSSVDNIKLDLAFIMKYENEEEHELYIQHCKDYGVASVDPDLREFSLFPLKYHVPK